VQPLDKETTPGTARPWVRALVAWRWLAFAGALLAGLLVAGLGIPRLRFDVSNEALFVEGDPTLERFDELQRTFGSDEVLYLLVDAEDPFQGTERDTLLALGERLSELDFVESMRSPLHSPVVFDEG
jgi:predicted RND superfamily exporter protein